MKHKRLMLCTTFLLMIGLTWMQAQEALPATGGDATGSGGSVSYTIGQVFYITNTGTGGTITQGVQQPYEISTIGIEEPEEISLAYNCKVYPNPTPDIIVLSVEDYALENLSLLLYDMQGKTLQNRKVSGTETNISMADYAASTYFLKVIDNSKEIKTFKIVKK